jgi:23S rRNA pseudouridine1911/1915/1917 synthase
MADVHGKNIVVDAESGGLRLDIILSRTFPGISRAKLQKRIENNAVFVNGAPVKKNTHVAEGCVISISDDDVDSSVGARPKAENIALDVIYEDEYLIAINKPAGLVVHPGNGNPKGTVVNALLFHIPEISGGETLRPGIVHRLDKDTSGVLLAAKNDAVHAALARQFAGRNIQKEYVGMCAGARPPEHGVIDMPIGRSVREPLKRAVRDNGKDAVTEFWLVAYCAGISVVRIRPHTGRTHQIRVHLSAKGFPILCDPVYGGGKECIDRLTVLDRPFGHKVYKCFSRHALHARRITFEHPHTKEMLTLTADFPEDFKKALSVFDEGKNAVADPLRSF